MTNTIRLHFLLVVCLAIASGAIAGDWPEYRRDLRRGGHTDEQVNAAKLSVRWTWRSPHPPRPAWAGPAKRDAYRNLQGLPSMRDYDAVFHPVVAKGRVYFGSSVDDSVHCLDASTGKELWSFATDGPVRIAPAVVDGCIFFGSDDGYAYCLDSFSGTLKWKFTPVAKEQHVLNDGRLISRWPCRTGVLVDGGIAYFANSLLPWKESYLCAVDAKTGRTDGDGRYVKVLNGLTLEGPLAASPEMLIVPQGRVAPRLFKRTDGTSLGSLKGGGGCFVVLTSEHIFHGSGADSRLGGIASSNSKTRAPIATYKSGSAIVVVGDMSYMLTDDSLIASDFVKRKHLWTADCPYPYCLVAAGDTLLIGGEDRIAGFDTASGKLVASHQVDGKAYGLAVAGGRLFVSTDTGAIMAYDQSGPAEAKPNEPQDASDSLAQIKPDDDDRLVGRWVFQSPHVQEKSAIDLAGTNNATMSGPTRLQKIGDYQGVVLNGQTTNVLVDADHNNVGLPTRQISAEAWVRIDQPQRWGGILCAVQDNGSYERGWLLGYENSRFSFAVAGKEGNGRLTYMTAATDFEPQRWYHVAGTYDGDTMNLFVNGELSATSKTQKGDINYPPKTFFEIGAYHDTNEHYRMKGMLHETRVYKAVLTAEEIKTRFDEKAENFAAAAPTSDHLRLAVGPWVQFDRRNRAVIRWHTKHPSPTVLDYWRHDKVQQVTDPALKTKHEVALTQLKHKRVYHYVVHRVVEGQDQQTQPFQFDTFFNYSLGTVSGQTDSELSAKARAILDEANVDRGICVDIGCGDGDLAYELAKQSRLRVIGFDTNLERVEAARHRLKTAGVYGERVTIHHVDQIDKLPLPENSVNLVVSTRMLARGDAVVDAREIERILVPRGHAMITRGPDWANGTTLRIKAIDGNDGKWVRLEKAGLTGAGEWSHLYGRADNSAYGGESLGGVKRSDELEVQWIGRPGPRYQSDRGNRKPSPLSTGGRLFLQGWRRMIAVDAYNGTPLWSLEIPELSRFNMPRDCGNWCSDDDFVYAAVRNKCWKIDARTGQVVEFIDVAGDKEQPFEYDWGYLASDGQQMIGTAVKQGSSWTNIWGGAGQGWYDAKTGPVTHQICSDSLFSLDKQTGKLNWKHSKRLVLNSTITIGAGRIYFVESRIDRSQHNKSRRISLADLNEDLHLVALDSTTGESIWEQPLELPDDTVVYYLAFSNEKLVGVTSTGGKYQVNGRNATTGESLWTTPVTWQASHHGGHMSRPAIVGDKVYVRPTALDLYTGKQLPQRMPRGGCGTYACSANALFFRASTVTVWDREAGQSTKWSRLRPDCWLSTIPAGGMLLSPEGGGGCSCGSWMETSIGFSPIRKPSP